MQSSAQPVRRTQEQRSAKTRERLLDATVESLIEVGYSRTTTTAVCSKAGLSRGAQVHHFPRKEEMVIEAIAHMAKQQRSELLGQENRLPQGPERISVLLERIVEFFGDRIFYAALELWVAARTDEVLHESLLDFERAVASNLTELWRELGGDAASSSKFTDIIELTMDIARGMSLQKILHNDETRNKRLLKVWKEMVSLTLAQNNDDQTTAELNALA